VIRHEALSVFMSIGIDPPAAERVMKEVKESDQSCLSRFVFLAYGGLLQFDGPVCVVEELFPASVAVVA